MISEISETERSSASAGPPPPDAADRDRSMPPPAPTAPPTADRGVDAARAEDRDASGPPPPPTPPSDPTGDRTPRVTAATWVAATGALLLLVAAATFLAVSWDVLGLTARVAVVASITGAAIVGGHRLRSVLPAVGAVIFHLGALLVPVDAIGLALQLGLSAATGWMLTGMVTVGVLAPLAIAGRSRVLAASAVAGVPVFATGVGLAGLVAPSILVAGAAVASLGAMALRGSRVVRVWRGSTVALAATSVLLPLLALILDAGLAGGQIVTAIAAAGWIPASWLVPTVAGVLAVAAVATRATVARSPRLAAVTPVLAVVAAIVALLPEGTPRLALLLAGPLAFLLCELVAVITSADDIWGRPSAHVASGVEVLAAVVAVGAAQLVAIPELLTTLPDHELAIALGVAALAFAVGVLRRSLITRGLDGIAAALAGGVVVHLAAAITVALPVSRSPLPPLILVTLVSVAFAADAMRRSTTESRWYGPVRATVATGLLVLAAVGAYDTIVALPVAVLVATVAGLHLRSLTEHRDGVVTAALLAPVAALASLILAAFPGDGGIAAGVLAAGPLQVLVLQLATATLALLGLAATIERVPVVPDVIRGVIALVLLFALDASWAPASLVEPLSTDAQRNAIALLTPVPALLIVLAPATVWLLVDAVRTRRMALALMAAPLAVRLLASVVAGFGVGPVVLGAILLAAGLLAVVLAILLRSAVLRASLGLVALAAGVPGWILVEVTAHGRALALISIGLATTLAGVLLRHTLLGHVGGAVTVVGTWYLFDLEGITAVDLWLLPVAVQLAIAGWTLRRRSSLSSWALDVPPLLLVVVPALGERLVGGPGWHTVLAGAVAIAAVVHGGASGRGGPLTMGMLAVLAIVAVETVAYAALVPTWAWFAIAGAVLLAAAVLIERRGLSPRGAARRLRDLAADE